MARQILLEIQYRSPIRRNDHFGCELFQFAHRRAFLRDQSTLIGKVFDRMPALRVIFDITRFLPAGKLQTRIHDLLFFEVVVTDRAVLRSLP